MPILLFVPSILIHQSLAVAKSCDWYICKIVYFFQPGKSTKQRSVAIRNNNKARGQDQPILSTHILTTLHPLLQCCNISTNRIFWQGLGWHLLLISVALGSNERCLTRRDYDADPSMTVDNQEKWFLFSLELLNFDTMRNTQFYLLKPSNIALT